ncbi:MAG: DNA repair protein RadA [Alistipes sp.]|nr:DNA repair protein RadA [Alistipes sp.]
MAKVKKMYVCRECGYDASKWLGKCPSCGAWNSFAEEVVAAPSSVPALVASRAIEPARPQKVQDIECGKTVRLDTGNSEVNRVLGGGVVPGSLVLLGGEPGIGKSTLSLQLALTDNGMKTLYVSGEESAEQIRLRADRIGIHNQNCTVYTETLLENVVAQIEELKPHIVVIDSIQTMASSLLDSSPGSVSQIRECAATLLKYAKSTGTAIFIIGHITKEGTIAGPKVLEHIVDVVLQFEGDNNNIYRILRGIKNRFGATFEIGVFEMTGTGLKCVDNPSEILLTHYAEPLSGVAVGASVDGVRPYLIEVQALVSQAAYGTPQRNTTGFDSRRMNMLLAVVEKKVGLKMFQKDVFLNFAGGFKVADTGLDLAVIAAVVSSYYDTPLCDGICFAGEIGLSGEVRPAPRTEQRVAEAARLGFSTIVISGYAPKPQKVVEGIEVVRINSVGELARHIFNTQVEEQD